MKCSVLLALAVSAAVLIAAAPPSRAQEVGDEGVYGYTSIQYDSQSNQLTI